MKQKKSELAVSKKENLATITVMREDGVLVCAPISFFVLFSDKRKKLNPELVKKLAPKDKVIFIGCSKKEENSFLKEENERILKFLSKNQKYAFYFKGNKEVNDSGVIYRHV